MNLNLAINNYPNIECNNIDSIDINLDNNICDNKLEFYNVISNEITDKDIEFMLDDEELQYIVYYLTNINFLVDISDNLKDNKQMPKEISIEQISIDIGKNTEFKIYDFIKDNYTNKNNVSYDSIKNNINNDLVNPSIDTVKCDAEKEIITNIKNIYKNENPSINNTEKLTVEVSQSNIRKYDNTKDNDIKVLNQIINDKNNDNRLNNSLNKVSIKYSDIDNIPKIVEVETIKDTNINTNSTYNSIKDIDTPKDTKDFVKGLITTVKYIANNNIKKLNVNLSPKEFGSIEIEVKEHSGKIYIKINVEEDRTLKSINNILPDIKKSLDGTNIQVITISNDISQSYQNLNQNKEKKYSTSYEKSKKEDTEEKENIKINKKRRHSIHEVDYLV